jgi:hypothetical protein
MHDPIQWLDPMEALMARLQPIFDSVAGAALPKAEAAASDPNSPRQPAELYKDALAEILTTAEQAARQSAITLAYREGRGASAEGDGDAAAEEFRSLTSGKAVKRLIADRYVDASAAGDVNFCKRVEDTMRRKLRWKHKPKGKAPKASPGAVAELAGKRQLSRPMSLNNRISAGPRCVNCSVPTLPIGEEFCDDCMSWRGHEYLDEVLSGKRRPDHESLSPELLEQARQQWAEIERERQLERQPRRRPR